MVSVNVFPWLCCIAFAALECSSSCGCVTYTSCGFCFMVALLGSHRYCSILYCLSMYCVYCVSGRAALAGEGACVTQRTNCYTLVYRILSLIFISEITSCRKQFTTICWLFVNIYVSTPGVIHSACAVVLFVNMKCCMLCSIYIYTPIYMLLCVTRA